MALRADAAVVRAAVDCRGCALRYASPEFKNDRATVLAAVAQGARPHPHSPTPLASPPSTPTSRMTRVSSAVAADGMALEFADARLRADLLVVQAAVAQNVAAAAFSCSTLHKLPPVRKALQAAARGLPLAQGA